MRISAYSIFSIFLTLIVGLMIFLSFDYNGKARFFPLLFGFVTIILILFQLLSDCFAGVEKKLTFVGQESVFSKLMESGEESQNSASKSQGESISLIRVFRIFLWLIALTTGLYFLNYVAVSVAFIFLMIAVEAKAGWFRALIVALCVGVFIFVLFDLILSVNFQV